MGPKLLVSHMSCNHIAKGWVPLDWFHIGNTFQNVKNALGEVFEKSWICEVESLAWASWWGTRKIELLNANLTDEEKSSKLKGFMTISRENGMLSIMKNDNKLIKLIPVKLLNLTSNQSLMLDTKEWKMQWTRAGAHNVLQIRAMITMNGSVNGSRLYYQRWEPWLKITLYNVNLRSHVFAPVVRGEW